MFELADHLPAEAAEALLELATGGTPVRPVHAAEDSDPFAHPDAQRRFRLMANAEELERAFDFPWEQWTVFLHPAQRTIVERRYNGPARVGGSAGTGKTVVALHRAVHLARANPQARVLLTTFSETLADSLRVKLVRLVGSDRGIVRADHRRRDRPGRHAVVRGCVRSGDAGGGTDAPRAPPGVIVRRRCAPVQRTVPRNRVARRCRRLAALDVGVVSGRSAARDARRASGRTRGRCSGPSSNACNRSSPRGIS